MLRQKPTSNPLRKLFLAILLAAVLVAGLAWWGLVGGGQATGALTKATSHWVDGKTPGQLIRYAMVRLDGHPTLSAAANPPLLWLQARFERTVPVQNLPTLGKGQQPKAMQPMMGQVQSGVLPVDSVGEIAQAVSTAQAGQTILIKPGSYRFLDKVKTGSAGTSAQPITLRALEPGQVFLEFDTQEGITVSQPYWIFENLQIRGVCRDHNQCEHAFHVVGKAHHTVLRNNFISDFNAHVKVNGENGNWPDDGLLAFNTLTNSAPRQTNLPVTPLDMVGANRWVLADNFVSNFVKLDGDKISYGMFMKGGGRGGRIERNLVVCTPSDVSQPGARVGISLGGGGTGKGFCRDPQCELEYSNGLVVNNIVAHCNDAGLDVNKAADNLLAFNTLINTSGIDARNAGASSNVYGNLLEGRIHARNGAQLKESMNELDTLRTVFEQVDALNFQCSKLSDNVPSLPLVTADFSGAPRRDGTLPGAFSQCPNPVAQ